MKLKDSLLKLSNHPAFMRIADQVHNVLVRKEIGRIVKNGLPLFSYIGIETLNYCNGECDFCPVNRRDNPHRKQKMEDETFVSIIDQLKTLDYRGVLTISGNNEPLLDSRILDFVDHIKHSIPACKIEMYTNGILLDRQKLDRIMEGVGHLAIDNYRGEQGAKAVQDLHVERFGNRIAVNQISPRAIRTSRAGQAKNKVAVRGLKSPCTFPFFNAIVRADGGMSQCCFDALGKTTMGNVKEQSLVDIWNGDAYNRVRQEILISRQNNPLCRGCDFFSSPPNWVRDVKKVLMGWLVK